MVLNRNYRNNKIIDLTEQNRMARIYYRFVNKLLSFTTAPEDIISLNTAKNVLQSTSFLHRGLTAFMNEINAARMVQITMNLAVVAWQWLFPLTNTWFSYFLTSPSGLKKVYQCILVNPLYGLLFYGTFYIKLIGGTSDEKRFNQIAEILGLPKHADMGVDSTLTKIINNVSEKLIGSEVKGYKTQIKMFMTIIISATAQQSLSKILIDSLRQSNANISLISKPAVYISDRNMIDFDDSDIQDQLKFLEKEHNNIKKYIKKQVNPKNKQLKNRMFMQIAEVKSPEGDVICLNKCARRVKTQMGCYCEGDCGSTTFLGGKKWCWVDPTKCKNGKLLDTYGGYAYDKCDTKNLSNNSKCFTGKKYTDCVTKPSKPSKPSRSRRYTKSDSIFDRWNQGW